MDNQKSTKNEWTDKYYEYIFSIVQEMMDKLNGEYSLTLFEKMGILEEVKQMTLQFEKDMLEKYRLEEKDGI